MSYSTAIDKHFSQYTMHELIKFVEKLPDLLA